MPPVIRPGRRRPATSVGSAPDSGDEHAMAYAQLTATKVAKAAQLALQDIQERIAAESGSGQDRADLVRLQWLLQLATASGQEDEAHALVTVTAEDFSLIAERYVPVAAC
jgi:hypothetical protein